MLDFSQDKKPIELAEGLSLDDLRGLCNESIDTLLGLLDGLTDAHVTFNPVDEEADDPFAKEGEENIGWSIAHLIAHVTASSEEGAAFSSLLARGVPEAEERPRYETPWQDIKTHAHCVQRLEESRRIRLAYLDTWPDTPHLANYRKISEGFVERFGQLNAPASLIFGLGHEVGHYDQIREVREQALKALGS